MTHQAKRIRAIYMLLLLLAVLLPLTGWFARSCTQPHPTPAYPRSLRPYVSCTPTPQQATGLLCTDFHTRQEG